jgi:CheY-like chemotaxis protein
VAILAAVDDLLFRSKIRAVARHVNADVAFAQTQEDLLTQARDTAPSLVIFDLNHQKLDPVAAIAALKGDPALAGVRTIAFASHVHVQLIDAARQAGADQVLARSQFAGHLADILASAVTS